MIAAPPISRGIVCAGEVLPGSDWVLRDEAAWWRAPADAADLRVRRNTASLLVGHWTGGNAKTGPGTGASVVRSMKARLRDDGSPMSVSIHFVIGWDGMVWQTADLRDACVHAATSVNLRSIGVECCWPGTEAQAERLGVDGTIEPRVVRGKRVRCLRPSDELIASWTRLARFLSSTETTRLTHGAVDIARRTFNGSVPISGAIDHQHVPGTTKVDAGGYLIDALRGDGWV